MPTDHGACAKWKTACDGCYGKPTLPKKTDERKFLLAPKASEANKRAFYLCPGFKWLLLCCEKEITVIEFAIGGLRKCPKFIGSGHTF